MQNKKIIMIITIITLFFVMVLLFMLSVKDSFNQPPAARIKPVPKMDPQNRVDDAMDSDAGMVEETKEPMTNLPAPGNDDTGMDVKEIDNLLDDLDLNYNEEDLSEENLNQ